MEKRPFPSEHGSYILASEILNPVNSVIGALGIRFFKPGVYLYAGSAKGFGGINSRISHHLRVNPRFTWHFDYLRPHLDPREVWFLISEDRLECKFIDILHKSNLVEQSIKKFGSSDCHNQCFSHLLFTDEITKIGQLFKNLQAEIFNMKRIVFK